MNNKKFNNILIKGIEKYYPNNFIPNSYFIEHFKKQGKEVEGLLEHLGRTGVYRSKDTNSLDMAVKSSELVIKNTNTNKDDIDMIVFSTETPEYTLPSNALKLNALLKTKNAHIVFDINSNCTGLITALDFIKNTMIAKKLNKVLLVGNIYYSLAANPYDTIGYPNISDASVSIILERKEEDFQRGILDSNYYTNARLHEYMNFPACGLSKIFDENLDIYSKKQKWIPHDVSYFSDDWKRIILEVLDRNNLKPNDISQYLLSQFSKSDVFATLDKLNLSYDKTTYVGDKYGYTGCTSPFYALKDAYEQNKIKDNDYIILCSVSCGYTMSTVLYKY